MQNAKVAGQVPHCKGDIKGKFLKIIGNYPDVYFWIPRANGSIEREIVTLYLIYFVALKEK